MSMYNKVLQFHAAFGLLIGDIPALPDVATRKLRCDLLAEEVSELMQAETDDDLIEIADALADIDYIVCGTAVAYGLATVDSVSAPLAMSPSLPAPQTRQSYIKSMEGFWKAYTQAENNNDLMAIGRALQDIIDCAADYAHAYNIPLNAVFIEVHASNMAKLIDGKVLRRADGKVQKPDGWQPPNIHSVLFGA